MSKGDRIGAAIFGLLSLLAIVVLVNDYLQRPGGLNQGAAIGGSTLIDLYSIAGGQAPPLDFQGLGGL